jgi:cell division septation protein DedD
VAQDDYYYEIQLTNKQLVFYFMGGAVVLILSFLAGVMVGRGVDAGTGDVQAARAPARDERMVTEEAQRAAPGAEPSAEELTYAQRLESDKPEESLAVPPPPGKDPSRKVLDPKPASAPSAAPTASPAPVKVARAEAPKPDAPKPEPPRGEAPKAAPSAAEPVAKPDAGPPVRLASGAFTIQVGAFKDKTTAEAVAGRLKSKGYAAYLVSPEGGGLFNVRVGSYVARTDAERVLSKLRDDEKFKPFIVKP